MRSRASSPSPRRRWRTWHERAAGQASLEPPGRRPRRGDPAAAGGRRDHDTMSCARRCAHGGGGRSLWHAGGRAMSCGPARPDAGRYGTARVCQREVPRSTVYATGAAPAVPCSLRRSALAKQAWTDAALTERIRAVLTNRRSSARATARPATRLCHVRAGVLLRAGCSADARVARLLAPTRVSAAAGRAATTARSPASVSDEMS